MSRRITAFIWFAVVALLAAACGGGGGGETTGATGGTGGGASGSISVMAVWTGAEQAAFKAVIDGFTSKNPDATVNYTSAGDQLPTQLSTAVQGGNPPDVAALPQPGLMADFAKKNALQPLDFAKADIESNFGQSVVDLGTVDGTFYGFLFKAANKSLVWYNVKSYQDAGVTPADDWDTWIKNGDTLAASGVPPYSIGGADGWTLTDLFENIYLRQAGPDKYDQLATHQIPWTDQSVKDALKTMAEVIGDSSKIAGGTEGALQTDFPTSVTQVFADPPKAAQVMEGDFVAGVITDSTKAEPKTGFDVFPFPSVNGSPSVVVGGGDTIVMFKDSPVAEAFVKYLASPEAAEIWAAKGGFATLNKNVDASVYPDDITRETANLADVETFRFDLSDLQPAEFGGTVGQGLFKEFQDFLQNPTNIDGVTKAMEASAKKAYGS
ncbi:MAG TPA: extracellular solute-binding protein [Gaiellaceae bacterium]